MYVSDYKQDNSQK